MAKGERRRDAGKHLDELVLHQLESSDRLSELFPALGVGERVLEGAERAAGGLHATNPRVIFRTRAVSAKLFALASLFSVGTRQSSMVIMAFCTTRSAILSFMTSAEKPGVPFSTTKPLT